MATVATVLEHRLEDRLMPDIIEGGHRVAARLVSARELVTRLAELHVDVALVGAGPGSLTHELMIACDRESVRIVALAANDLERAQALEVGLPYVLDAHSPWEAIDDALRGAVLSGPDMGPPARAGGHRAGRVVVVWGPNGAPGRTTVAINIAAEMAAAGNVVTLVDGDTFGGSIAPALGLIDEVPGFAAACRLAGSDALDRTELERVAQWYTSSGGSFRVLSGLTGTSRWPELSGDRVDRALIALSRINDYVVVDVASCLEQDEEISSDLFAPRRNAATRSALECADRVIALGAADPVGLSRYVRAFGDVRALVAADRIVPVVNRVRSSVLGLDARGQVRTSLERFAGIDRVLLLAQDQTSVDRSLLTARTLRDAAPRSPLRQGIATLVREPLAVESRLVVGPRRRSRTRRRLNPA